MSVPAEAERDALQAKIDIAIIALRNPRQPTDADRLADGLAVLKAVWTEDNILALARRKGSHG